MDKQNKTTTLILIATSFLLILIITIGISFAYFTADIEGSENEETVTLTGGIMKIHYDSEGPNINLSNVFPKDEAIATKEFTLTGESTTNDDMDYHIMLVVTNNTFTDNAIQYKLTSTNTDNNGEVAPSITELKGIPTGENKEVFLGNATFESPAENAVHTYNLHFYFPRGEVQDNVNQGKTFNAYVSLRGEHRPPLLSEVLLSKFEENISEPEEDLFESINTDTENRMIIMEDDYGTSYVIRGAKDYVENNLIFAEHQWKIVRINGDDSIRIIYNGACPNNECSINTSGALTQIGKSIFNPDYKPNTLVGYMYGNNPDSYETAHINENDSIMKKYLENWYVNNILGTEYKKNISDSLFCGDRVCESGGCTGTSTSDYAAKNRLETNKNPSLKCIRKKDIYTVDDINVGNGDLLYPIGLITADEVAIAGLRAWTENSTNYLFTESPYVTMTPYNYYVYANIAIISSTGELRSYRVDDLSQYSGGVRPVINLEPNTTVTGSGSSTDPFIVQ